MFSIDKNHKFFVFLKDSVTKNPIPKILITTVVIGSFFLGAGLERISIKTWKPSDVMSSVGLDPVGLWLYNKIGYEKTADDYKYEKREALYSKANTFTVTEKSVGESVDQKIILSDGKEQSFVSSLYDSENGYYILAIDGLQKYPETIIGYSDPKAKKGEESNVAINCYSVFGGCDIDLDKGFGSIKIKILPLNADLAFEQEATNDRFAQAFDGAALDQDEESSFDRPLPTKTNDIKIANSSNTLISNSSSTQSNSSVTVTTTDTTKPIQSTTSNSSANFDKPIEGVKMIDSRTGKSYKVQSIKLSSSDLNKEIPQNITSSGKEYSFKTKITPAGKNIMKEDTYKVEFAGLENYKDVAIAVNGGTQSSGTNFYYCGKVSENKTCIATVNGNFDGREIGFTITAE